jgi:hypothetical protein
VSTGTQEISVAAGGVTTGKVHYTLAGWLGGYSSQADHAVLDLTFENSKGKAIGFHRQEVILRERHYSAITVGCFGMCMTTLSIRCYVPLVAVGAGLCLLSLTACSSSSSAAASGGAAAAGGGASAAAVAASAASGGSSGKTVDACTLVTAAELSQAVGVQYTGITDPGGNLCAVKGPGSASFDYTVQAESAANAWSEQVATIKGDDGQA